MPGMQRAVFVNKNISRQFPIIEPAIWPKEPTFALQADDGAQPSGRQRFDEKSSADVGPHGCGAAERRGGGSG